MTGSSFSPLNIENYQQKSTSNVPIPKKKPSNDLEDGVRSENWFVVYARYTILMKLTSPSIMIDLTIKYKIGNR